jgi:hypothetical protein
MENIKANFIAINKISDADYVGCFSHANDELRTNYFQHIKPNEQRAENNQAHCPKVAELFNFHISLHFKKCSLWGKPHNEHLSIT